MMVELLTNAFPYINLQNIVIFDQKLSYYDQSTMLTYVVYVQNLERNNNKDRRSLICCLIKMHKNILSKDWKQSLYAPRCLHLID